MTATKKDTKLNGSNMQIKLFHVEENSALSTLLSLNLLPSSHVHQIDHVDLNLIKVMEIAVECPTENFHYPLFSPLKETKSA